MQVLILEYSETSQQRDCQTLYWMERNSYILTSGIRLADLNSMSSGNKWSDMKPRPILCNAITSQIWQLAESFSCLILSMYVHWMTISFARSNVWTMSILVRHS